MNLAVSRPDELDVAELVARAARADERAARALFDRYHPRVMGYCVLSTDGDRDAARDLAQEVFIKVFRNLESLREPERFSAWLWTIVHRQCATRGSARSRYGEILQLFDLDREVIRSSEDKRERERRIACVQAVLADLDDDDLKQIVTMKYTEPEHTTREISAKLGIPHGTVTVKLMRFRKAIKRRLLRALEDLDLEPLP